MGTPASREVEVAEEDQAVAKPKGGRIDKRFPGVWVTLALLISLAIFAALTPGLRFLNPTNLWNILLGASELLIISVPTTYILIAAGLDLSVGAVLVLSSVVGASLMQQFSGTAADLQVGNYPTAFLSVPLGVVGALVVGTLCGCVNGVLIARYRLPPFIVTLGTLGIYTGLALVATNGTNVVGIPVQLQDDFGAARAFGLVPLPVLLALVVAGFGWIVLNLTRFGVRTFAIGANVEAARLLGVNVERHLLILYASSGLAAGMAGLVDLARFRATSVESHTTDNLQAITSVVLGGTSLFGGIGGMAGTIVGSLFPTTLTNGFIQLDVPPFWQPVVLGIVLIAAIAYDSVRRKRREH